MPPRRDIAIAGVLAIFGVTEAAVAGADFGWFATALVATAPLAWRRQHPIGVIGWTLAAIAIAGHLGHGLGSDSVLPLPVTILLAYTAGREAPSWRLTALGAAGIAIAMAFAFADGGEAENTPAEDLVALIVLVGGAAAAGHVMRLRHGENVQLQRLTARLAAEQEERARAAVVQERQRMARELHDIVAHGVSLIAIQAAAAEDLMGRDEARARASLQAVQDTARTALGEMRRLLSVLRATDAERDHAPQPGLAAVGDLVQQARASGLPVDLQERGVRPRLSPGLELSVYRILQEALTNVRKHAGAAPAEVVVAYGADELVLEVSNATGASPAPGFEGAGYGLTGMGERARVYGGAVEAGNESGRFVVRARFPLEAG
jgi:signal transduction histidine kinase